MIDYRLALMCGTDLVVPSCKVSIHQPKIKEIAFIGEIDFFMGVQVLCIDKSMLAEDKTLLLDTNNFQIFMMVMQETTAKDKREAAMKVLQLLFPTYRVLLTPRALSLSKPEGETITIDENNFEDLQEVFRLVFCTTSEQNKEKNFNPANKKAQEIADKLMKARKKVAEQKGEASASIFGQYISVLTIGLQSMSLQDLMDLTMFQIYDLIERYSLYVNYDLDIRSRLAGAKIEKQPENWMRNLH